MNAFDLLGRVGGDARDAVGRWPVVTGLLTAEDFAAARLDQGEAATYEDWIDLREGAQMALSLAGVEAASVYVAARPFRRWCRLTRRQPTERALDRFADLAARLAAGSEILVFAEVAGSDLDPSPEIGAWRSAANFADWRRRRAAQRRRARLAGAPVETAFVEPADFLDWRACFKEQDASTTDLDGYALLALEDLLLDGILTPLINAN
jgi:hypothetical protein